VSPRSGAVRRAGPAALALGFAAAVSSLAGCGGGERLPGADVVAEVAGAELRNADFVAFLERNLGESGAALESEALSSLLDQFVEERLLVRLAVDRQLVAESVAAPDAVEALLRAEGAPPIATTAIAAYYAEHAAEFRAPDRVALSAIRVEDRATADRALRELRGGAPFADVARRLSADPAAERGGEHGAVAREELPRELAETVFRLSPGEISGVLPGDAGFYLFRVERRIPGRTLPLEEVREEIVRRLAGARADRAYARFVAEARSRYAVRVYERNLPFRYSGKLPTGRAA
jgi:hypothetical protein